MGVVTQTTEEVQSNLDWHIDKTSGVGIKVDTTTPTFPWRDLIGLVLPDPVVTTRPSIAAFQTGVNAYEYQNGDKLNCIFHMPHDYVPGSDMFLHLHWGHNGTAISGTFEATAVCSYGSRDGVFGSPVTTTITDAGLTIGACPQYCHPVTEVQLTAASPSAAQLDSDNLEVDGLVMVTFTVTTNPTITGGTSALPFIFTGDIHYQSTGIGTKQNASPFYT